MWKKRKSKMEFRYYKMIEGIPIIALLGEKWIQTYGEGIDYLHFHNCMEIGYCYHGQGVLTIGETDYRFSGKQFSIIPQNCPHTTNSDPGTVSRWEYLFVDVEAILHFVYPSVSNEKKRERMLQRINSRGVFRRVKESPKMAEKVLQVLNIMREMEEFYLEEACNILAAFFIAFARENRLDTMDTGHEKVNILISDALNYISEHYMEPLRIEMLADYCHISETHLRRLFSFYINMGPLEYINLIRIQNACEKLRKTDNFISDIAFECGFSTLSTFHRNFKQVTGLSPFEWRKNPENFEQLILKFKIHSEEGW